MSIPLEQQARAAAMKFALKGNIASIEPYGSGHINDTFLVTQDSSRPRYILQRINKHVFREPENVMENISGVTRHLREKVIERHGDPDREVLNVIPALDGRSFYLDDNNEYWRVYLFVEDTVTLQSPDTPEIFYLSACAFGEFGAMLGDYPAQQLYETIPGFHDTPGRYRNLDAAISSDSYGRVREVREEIGYIMSLREEAATLYNLRRVGKLPLRVTHNDTKLNNVLLDASTGKGVCVIDLDTVMPGLSVDDFGDSIRFGASTAAEDEKDLNKCELNLNMFEAYASGYIECAHHVLTEMEIRMFSMGAKLMTLECGVRFLTDYIDGDSYFRIHRDGQNLDRARTQLKLVRDITAKWNKMRTIVEKIAGGNLF